MARAVMGSATDVAKRGLLPPPPSRIPSHRPLPLQSSNGAPGWDVPACAESVYGSSSATVCGPSYAGSLLHCAGSYASPPAFGGVIVSPAAPTLNVAAPAGAAAPRAPALTA